MAFNSCIFSRTLSPLCKLYPKFKMDRKTEASDAQKKQELLKTTENSRQKKKKTWVGIHCNQWKLFSQC